MRVSKILGLIGLIATSVQAGEIKQRQETDIDIIKLNKSEVRFDTAAKAWYLDLEGVMRTNGSTGMQIQKEPGGLTLSLFPSNKQSPFFTTTTYQLELGYAREDKWPLGHTSRFVASSAPSFLFGARVRLPEDYGMQDRSLRIILPNETSEPSLVLMLDWMASKKEWRLSFGAVTSVPPFSAAPVKISRFNVMLDNFALQKAEIASMAKPQPAINLSGAYRARRCEGDNDPVKLVAIPAGRDQGQIVLFETHAAKDGVLDPWALGCALDEPGTVALEAFAPVGTQKDVEAKAAEWSQYSRDFYVFGQEPKPRPGILGRHILRLTWKKGAAAWTLQKLDTAVAYP